MGYAFEPDFSASFETSIWTSQVGDVTWAFTVYSPTATWYPGAKGFFLRGGLGWGRIEAEQGGLSRSENGVGALAAIGYEWRLTRRFALAPQIDAQWLNVGSGIRGNFFNLTLGLNWYL